MKVLPKILILKTEEQQADYFFDREFSYFDYTEIDSDEWQSNAQVIEPDNEILYNEFIENNLLYQIDYEEELNEYNNQTGYEVTAEDDDRFRDWLVDKYYDRFIDWKLEELHVFPMWNTIFFAKSNSIASNLQNNVDKLYSLGLTLVSYNDSTGIMVNSAGHSFYADYWIPLYKNINKWIKEVDEKQYKEYIKKNILTLSQDILTDNEMKELTKLLND